MIAELLKKCACALKTSLAILAGATVQSGFRGSLSRV